MSSILRALKKLESEPGRQAGNDPLGPSLVPMADNAGTGSPLRTVLKVAGTGIVCGVVVLAGCFLLSDKRSFPPAAGVPGTSRSDPGQVETSRTTAEQNKATADPLASGEQKPAAAAPQEVAVPRPTPVKIAQKTILPAAVPAPLPKPIAAAVMVRDATPAQPVAAVHTARPPAPPPAPAPEIPLLQDPGIRLQAITWSKTPGKRVVVINNRILRQGETVAGYRIDTVNQDDVVLSSRGEKWKVLFRIK